eukprot:TRINITY_DN42160_c0_g1_i2.p1 TRINITY_DN42160_c0_g1~~TRINITY_DN42160_c0_g1_i2.p1  ORF type:complete len:182 (+),score=13.14 TRINITY_DN42160_c0_g1_i2:146-691(+)
MVRYPQGRTLITVMDTKMQRKKNSSSQRPFSCKACNKSFVLQSNLKKHEKTHSYFTCSHCNKSFAQQFHLVCHEIEKHAIYCNKESMSSEIVIKNENLWNNNEIFQLLNGNIDCSPENPANSFYFADCGNGMKEETKEEMQDDVLVDPLCQTSMISLNCRIEPEIKEEINAKPSWDQTLHQ